MYTNRLGTDHSCNVWIKLHQYCLEVVFMGRQSDKGEVMPIRPIYHHYLHGGAVAEWLRCLPLKQGVVVLSPTLGYDHDSSYDTSTCLFMEVDSSD